MKLRNLISSSNFTLGLLTFLVFILIFFIKYDLGRFRIEDATLGLKVACCYSWAGTSLISGNLTSLAVKTAERSFGSLLGFITFSSTSLMSVGSGGFDFCLSYSILASLISSYLNTCTSDSRCLRSNSRSLISSFLSLLLIWRESSSSSISHSLILSSKA